MAQTYNLRAERTRLDWTRERAALVLGVHPELLATWEEDISSMPVDALRRAAKMYGCSMDYLVGLVEGRRDHFDRP